MKNGRSNYEIKKMIVEKGESAIFKNWHEHEGITMEDFLEGLKWLCEDPRDERGRLTRELGCHKGKVVKLRRVNNLITVFYEVDSGLRYGGYVSISARDRV